jgi:hypothetical protein
MIRSITIGALAALSAPVAVYAQQSDDLFIPAVVETMWVMLQDPSHTGEGSSESLAIAIPPSEFRAGLVQWQGIARSRGWKLVVTAYASEGDDEWPHWKIRYKGKRLKFARYKDPNGERVFTGVEFPLQ